jgi:hypothetical protein
VEIDAARALRNISAASQTREGDASRAPGPRRVLAVTLVSPL